jgi:hypothetical protein
MTEKESLEKEFYKYLTFGPLDGEAYRFNIKMPPVRLPEAMEEKLSDDQRADLVDGAMTEALEMFVEELMQNYPWITGWETEGRSGGWLVINTPWSVVGHDGRILAENDPQESPKDWSPLSYKEARKRLADLWKIDHEVRDAKRMLLDDMKTQAFWGAEKYWKRS